MFTFPAVAMCAANKRKKKSHWGKGDKKRSQRGTALTSWQIPTPLYRPAQVTDYITDLGGCAISLWGVWESPSIKIYPLSHIYRINRRSLFFRITLQIWEEHWLNQVEKLIHPFLLPGWNCNWLLSACLKKSLRSCLFIQHAAARDLRVLDKSDHMTPALAEKLAAPDHPSEHTLSGYWFTDGSQYK